MREMPAFPWAEALPQPRNLGFAGGANAGLERVETPVAVVLNPDVELDPDFGVALTRAFAENERLGVAGSLLLYPDGETVQHAGGIITDATLSTDHRGRGEPLSPEHEQELEIDFATGAAIGLRMEAVRQVGGWDTRFSPVYYEDVDLAARMRAAGWQVRLIPAMRGLHHEGVTLGHAPDYYVYLHRNRILYALEHLTPEEWRREFLPAEFERLRAYLTELPPNVPAQVVGFEAIDMLLRDLDPFAGVDAALSLSLMTDAPAPDLDELLAATHDVGWRPLDTRVPLLGRLFNLFSRLGPRWYIDRALAGQRVFNDAVVRAFQAQRDLDAARERQSREHLAATLLLALILLERTRRLAPARDPDPDDPPENDE